MRHARKIMIGMLLAGFVLGLPAAIANAQSTSSSGSGSDGTCTSFRCRAMNVFFDASVMALETGCTTAAEIATGLLANVSSAQ